MEIKEKRVGGTWVSKGEGEKRGGKERKNNSRKLKVFQLLSTQTETETACRYDL